MYSPKISEELIPDIYRIAKAKGISMTKYVNGLIYQAIKDIKVEVAKTKEKVDQEKEVYVIIEEKR